MVGVGISAGLVSFFLSPQIPQRSQFDQINHLENKAELAFYDPENGAKTSFLEIRILDTKILKYMQFKEDT